MTEFAATVGTLYDIYLKFQKRTYCILPPPFSLPCWDLHCSVPQLGKQAIFQSFLLEIKMTYTFSFQQTEIQYPKAAYDHMCVSLEMVNLVLYMFRTFCT